MTRELRLGLNVGYWAGGPPPGAQATVLEAERLGFDSLWTAEAHGADALVAPAWGGGASRRPAPRTADRADRGAHARRDRDGGDDPRSPLWRQADPRPRCVRATGGGGVVRTAVRQAPGAHA